MASNPKTQRESGSLDAEHYELKVSAYDNVSALLLALVTMVTAVVFCLLVLWWTSRVFAVPPPVTVDMTDLGGGREDGVVGESLEIDAPEVSEIAKESDLVEPQVQDTLAMLTEAIATLEVDIDDPLQSQEVESGGGGRSTGDGRAVGKGSGEGGSGFSRSERWEVYFAEGATIDIYARQLDYFKIELGVLGGSNDIWYAYNLAKSRPDRRVGPGANEQRLYMSWRQGALRDADRALLERAGVPAGGRVIVQFYPPEVEQQLLQLEQAFRGLKADQIRKTRFGVRQQGGGYEFFVLDQTPL
jgi:hypothetical protein